MSFRRERALIKRGVWPVAGCDEAGRGPLAGPVVAAAVVLDPSRIPKGIDDSKRLTAERREELGRSIDALAEFTRNGAAASAQLPSLMTRMDTAVASLQGMADEIGAASRELRTQMRSGGDSLQTFGGRTLPELESLLSEIRRLTASFQRLSERLEDDPRTLLYGPQLDTPGPGE